MLRPHLAVIWKNVPHTTLFMKSLAVSSAVVVLTNEFQLMCLPLVCLSDTLTSMPRNTTQSDTAGSARSPLTMCQMKCRHLATSLGFLSRRVRLTRA
jgi:hypothetical protein